MRRLKVLFILCLLSTDIMAQFHPQAGLMGSHAIHKDSSMILAWADDCQILRGWMDIADTSLGKTLQGSTSDAHGKADGFVVSLGDGGEAIYTLSNPIMNGPGPDFAIFENGFIDPMDSNWSYMELAEVYVSNDGLNYFKFPSQCLQDTNTQINGVGQYSDCRKVHNLAGKYVLNYGTPFDLDEFIHLSQIDLLNIRYIKIRDVIGSLNNDDCSRDKDGRKINDPYPTPYPSGGFDLDALGLIHLKYPLSVVEQIINQESTIYPNPGTDYFSLKSNQNCIRLSIFNLQGNCLTSINQPTFPMACEHLKPGIYGMMIQFSDSSTQYLTWVKQ